MPPASIQLILRLVIVHAVSIGLLPLCLINKLAICWKYTLEWFEWYQTTKIDFVRYFRQYLFSAVFNFDR